MRWKKLKLTATQDPPQAVTTAYFKLLRTTFDEYLARMECDDLEPRQSYLTYDFDDDIDHRRWRVLGGMMVKDELRDLTNILNAWQGSLYRWHAWNEVLKGREEDEAWALRGEFLEALAHQCLLHPSAARDAITFVATNSMHQVRLAIGGHYRDYLDGDPKAPGDAPKNMSRRQKEKRLSDLVAGWPQSAGLMTHLRQIDDAPYRELTYDYRNRFSHAIGPRLALGETRAVVRSVVQAIKMTEQADGTFAPMPLPGKIAVSYGFGGTPALDMEGARTANLGQYMRARACYESYRALLLTGIAAIPLAL